jgi:hypothetical protein
VLRQVCEQGEDGLVRSLDEPGSRIVADACQRPDATISPTTVARGGLQQPERHAAACSIAGSVGSRRYGRLTATSAAKLRRITSWPRRSAARGLRHADAVRFYR